MAEGGSPDFNTETLKDQAKRLITGLPSFEYQFEQYCSSGRQHITILLCGKTGVGKSHLTNALVGKRLAKEGEDLNAETYEVTPYNFSMNGVGVTIVDTPGLADGTGNEEVYLKKIKENVTGFDAFIFCTEMSNHRIRNDDIITIQKLTEAFGPQLWEHAVVALTFANEVHPAPSNSGVTEQEFFDDRLRKFKKKIQEVVLKVGVPEEAIIKVPFVPTGDVCERRLPSIENWIVCFWIATFKRLNRSAKPTFLLANIDRFNCVSERRGGLSSGISAPRPELMEGNQLQKQGFDYFHQSQRPWDDQNADVNRDCRVLNRSQSLNEQKRQTPPKTLPKQKSEENRSRNEQGSGPDTPVGIDLDEASTGEIMMEIISDVGNEGSRVLGDFIRPGPGNFLSAVFGWFMALLKKWLQKKPSIKNEAVEEEKAEEQEGN